MFQPRCAHHTLIFSLFECHRRFAKVRGLPNSFSRGVFLGLVLLDVVLVHLLQNHLGQLCHVSPTFKLLRKVVRVPVHLDNERARVTQTSETDRLTNVQISLIVLYA